MISQMLSHELHGPKIGPNDSLLVASCHHPLPYNSSPKKQYPQLAQVQGTLNPS